MRCPYCRRLHWPLAFLRACRRCRRLRERLLGVALLLLLAGCGGAHHAVRIDGERYWVSPVNAGLQAAYWDCYAEAGGRLPSYGYYGSDAVGALLSAASLAHGDAGRREDGATMRACLEARGYRLERD